MRLPTPLSRRNPKLHKNAFGHCLIVAGSPHMLGAAALTSLSALRSGAGLVSLGVPKSCILAAQKKVANEIMVTSLTQINPLLKKVNVIAVGPGLGTSTTTQKFVKNLISTSPVPLVIDADGLNSIAKNVKCLTKTKTPKILTPHPGEMARLTRLTKQKIEANRKTTAVKFAKQNKCILLLKGQNTIVASPTGKTYVNKTGNVGMATAGSGDVLTGMITAFLAQGFEPFDAAKFGAYYHGKAGDLVAKTKTKASMIASDIIDKIPKALQN